jgi:hypothetical protein
MAKEKTYWRVRFMTDYPYSDTMVVEGDTEEEAWKDFETKHGYPRNEYCSIVKI